MFERDDYDEPDLIPVWRRYPQPLVRAVSLAVLLTIVAVVMAFVGWPSPEPDSL